MIDAFLRNRLVNKFRELIDEGYTEFEIKIIGYGENGYVINPTKSSQNVQKAKRGGE